MTVGKGGHIYLNTNFDINTRPSTQICVQCHLCMYCHIPQHKPTHSHLYPMSVNKAYRHLHQHKAFHLHCTQCHLIIHTVTYLSKCPPTHICTQCYLMIHTVTYRSKCPPTHTCTQCHLNTDCNIPQHKSTHSHL